MPLNGHNGYLKKQIGIFMVAKNSILRGPFKKGIIIIALAVVTGIVTENFGAIRLIYGYIKVI
jgi:hypothetical protein